MLIAGIDVGGTNIGVGLVDDDHAVLERGKKDTPQSSPQAITDTIIKLIDGLSEKPDAIGLGIPGVIHENRVLEVPNLAGWDESFDLVGQVEKHFGVPIALGNDANVGVIGEWVAGSAEGCDNVLGVWMGTGIGGGLILEGRPFYGSRGSAGEIGHVVTNKGGALCTCGQRGHIEAYAGRRSMEAAARSMMDSGRDTDLFKIQEEEGKKKLTSKVWARALDEGDELATELFDTAIDVLAVGVASLVNMLDVQRVVIGGGMAEKLGQDLADRIDRQSRPAMLHPNPDLDFVVAKLGDDSGLVGAAELARAQLIQP